MSKPDKEKLNESLCTQVCWAESSENILIKQNVFFLCVLCALCGEKSGLAVSRWLRIECNYTGWKSTWGAIPFLIFFSL